MLWLALCIPSFFLADAALTVTVASSTNTIFDKPTYVCDGVSDEVEIQAALDQVNKAGGGKVLLSNGQFNMHKNIAIFKNTVFEGAGMNNTILRLKNKASKFAKAGFIRCLTQNKIQIKKMSIDGNRANQATDSSTNYGRFAVYTEACNETVLDNLRVYNWYGYGLDPHGIGGTKIPSAYVTITNNVVHDNGWDGITVDKCIDSIVAYNTVYNNGRHGINVCTGCKRVYVHHNYVGKSGYNYQGTLNGCGIMVQNNQGYGTRDIQLQTNNIIQSYKGAICLGDVFDMEIDNNIMHITNTCLRVKGISDLDVNGVNLGINICTGNRDFYSESTYTGVAPRFLGTLNPKPAYVVVSSSSSMAGDFKCDGVNDEQEILRAIKYVGFYGGTITLSDGVFNVASHIEMMSNVVLQGQGMDATILRLPDNAPKYRYSGMIRGYGVENITIQKLTMDGNRQAQPNDQTHNYGKYGFYCEMCINVLMDNITTRNMWGYGIDPHGLPNEAGYSDGFVIKNSIVRDNGWDGITIDKTLNVQIENNIVHSNGRHGINIVTGSKYVNITNNNVYNNGFYYYTGSKGCGIMLQNNGLFGTSFINVASNIVSFSSNANVCTNGILDVKAEFNLLDGNSTCMKFAGTNNVRINSNNCLQRKRITISGNYNNNTYTIVNQTNVFYV